MLSNKKSNLLEKLKAKKEKLSDENRIKEMAEKQKEINIIGKAKDIQYKQGKLELIPIDRLKENPYQPRIEIKDEEVAELAKSIKENGLLQPILVYMDNDGYVIIAGHRRVAAYKFLGEKYIRAIVFKNQGNLELAKKAIVENLQRENLDLIETAIALKKYKEEFDKTLDDIAKEIGKNKVFVSRILNILNLPEEIIKDIKDNKSTKDITSLNLLNSYINKKFRMRNKSQNSQDTEAQEEFEKGKNEIFELYKGFLKYGREWLKEEIDKRLKEAKRKKTPDIKVEFGKRKTKIELNIPLTKEEAKKIKEFIQNLAETLKADKIDIKENKYLKKQKKKTEKKEIDKNDEKIKIPDEEADKKFKELDDIFKSFEE